MKKLTPKRVKNGNREISIQRHGEFSEIPQWTEKAKDKVYTSLSKDISSLESELVNLRDELKSQRFRTDAYHEMINVVEEQFNIKIRKI